MNGLNFFRSSKIRALPPTIKLKIGPTLPPERPAEPLITKKQPIIPPEEKRGNVADEIANSILKQINERQ